MELSLSVDNLFVFLVIFNYFAVPDEQQHRVLFWGVVGALALRGIFIGTGVGLLSHFHWVLYLFGALLIYSGIRFAVMGNHQIDPAANPLVRLLRRWIPVTAGYQGERFFVRNLQENGRLYATPLLIVLLVIETSDIVFSVDSIPAILAITLNAFIVYTSNVFAILGLRSMYFAVSGLMESFPLPSLWAGAGADSCGSEDARRRSYTGADCGDPGRGGRSAPAFDRDLSGVSHIRQ